MTMTVKLPRLALACLALFTIAAAEPLPEATADGDDGGRIVGGSPAPAGSAPWQIEIFSTYTYTPDDIAKDDALRDGDPGKRYYSLKQPWERAHRCGGAYIGDGWILTAAHCVVDVSGGTILTVRRVRMGTQNLARNGGTVHRIERAVYHKGFVLSEPFPNDIALIRIATGAGEAQPDPARTKAIRPIDEASDRPVAEADVMRVTGWGLTKSRQGAGAQARDGTVNRGNAQLLQVEMATLAPARCDAVPAYARRLKDAVLCVGAPDGSRDTCNGDSGGPMTRAQGKDRVLVGLVSWGKGCGLPNTPGIYTRVSQYAAWIARAKNASVTGQSIPAP